MKAASVISDPNYPFDNIFWIIGHEYVVIFKTRGPNVVQQIVKTSVNTCTVTTQTPVRRLT
jgi:hypothetical protein